MPSKQENMPLREDKVYRPPDRDENEVIYTIHQSIWLPSDDFYINIASSNEQVRRDSINVC